MLTGAIVVGIWGNISVLSGTLYEILPAFVLNLIVTVIVSKMTYKENEEIEQEFTNTLNLLEEERAKE